MKSLGSIRRSFAPWADPASKPYISFESITKKFGDFVAGQIVVEVFRNEVGVELFRGHGQAALAQEVYRFIRRGGVGVLGQELDHGRAQILRRHGGPAAGLALEILQQRRAHGRGKVWSEAVSKKHDSPPQNQPEREGGLIQIKRRRFIA